MGSNAGTHSSLLSDGQQPAPSCTVSCGFQTFSPAILSTWDVGSAVWSDRAWTYTHIGSFSTSAFQFKLQTSVDSRKASYTFVAPASQGIDLYILGETRRVIAPWAFSAGEPELDETWCESCETLPVYEAGVACQFDFCRRRKLQAGETVSFSALAGGKLDVFIKTVATLQTQEWNKASADLPVDDITEGAQLRPHLRTACHGLPNSRRGRGHRGISPPPPEGWTPSKSGWDTHAHTPNWLRRTMENESITFFYVPEETHWVDMPGRGFMHVDMCLCAIGFLRDAQAWQRQCFSSWKQALTIVQTWRKRLLVMTAANAGEDDEKENGEENKTTINFPVRTAFRAPPALKKSGSKSSLGREVKFAASVQVVALSPKHSAEQCSGGEE